MTVDADHYAALLDGLAGMPRCPDDRPGATQQVIDFYQQLGSRLEERTQALRARLDTRQTGRLGRQNGFSGCALAGCWSLGWQDRCAQDSRDEVHGGSGAQLQRWRAAGQPEFPRFAMQPSLQATPVIHWAAEVVHLKCLRAFAFRRLVLVDLLGRPSSFSVWSWVISALYFSARPFPVPWPCSVFSASAFVRSRRFTRDLR